MNREIKEILNQLQYVSSLENVTYSLNENVINKLVDCITNLQQEKTRIRKILIEHIEDVRYELNVILHSDNDLDYKNECYKEFELLNKNIRMILNKIDNITGGDEDE